MAGTSRIRARKVPRQTRSRRLNARILDAAARVLTEQGLSRFTTNRVAEEAGISIGSLYQYYPNKQAVLFHLQERETLVTLQAIDNILGDSSRDFSERIRAAVAYFFASEATEAPLRNALSHAGEYFPDTREFAGVAEAIALRLHTFLAEARSMGAIQARDLDFETEFIITLVSSVAEQVTSRTTDSPVLQRWADELSDVVCARLGIPPRGAALE